MGKWKEYDPATPKRVRTRGARKGSVTYVNFINEAKPPREDINPPNVSETIQWIHSSELPKASPALKKFKIHS